MCSVSLTAFLSSQESLCLRRCPARCLVLSYVTRHAAVDSLGTQDGIRQQRTYVAVEADDDEFLRETGNNVIDINVTMSMIGFPVVPVVV